ncbi:MAG: pyruvate dehydrogenase (acetyl-transferring) E1 component subunit alpha [Armatimonadetes bacterium]|nr:pyruvate dehydrogenase (acetyl-transferring) E1 component subunit alpha [Armatimonadota bacterium]
MTNKAPTKLDFPASLIKHDYEEMLFMRIFEEKCQFAFRNGKAGGYLHLYVGMEPLATGWLNSIRKGYDYVITAYRDHGHALVLGSDPLAVMCEILGRKGGLSNGKGGSMHLYDAEHQLYGGWGIVGAHTALGLGLAFAAKYRGEDRVTLCYLGDGAANAGIFYESLNMAGLWDLPIIYIIENNYFAMGTRLEYHAADTNLSKRGYPFGIESEQLDSMDVMEVRKDAARIIEMVRKEQKPYLVEALTYRFVGHGAADNSQELYRTKEEVAKARKRDPIHLLHDVILEHNILTQGELEALEEKFRAEVDEIYAKAEASPHPDPEDVYTNVYTDISPEVGH